MCCSNWCSEWNEGLRRLVRLLHLHHHLHHFPLKLKSGLMLGLFFLHKLPFNLEQCCSILVSSSLTNLSTRYFSLSPSCWLSALLILFRDWNFLTVLDSTFAVVSLFVFLFLFLFVWGFFFFGGGGGCLPNPHHKRCRHQALGAGSPILGQNHHSGTAKYNRTYVRYLYRPCR